MRLARTLLCVVMVAFAIQACGVDISYCDDDAVTREIRRMEGSITAVDTFNSSITVQWQGADLIHYSVTTFTVPEGMQFYKGTDMVDILDVNIGDPVTIEYHVDRIGAPQIMRMDISQ
jgi:hypothetical protein